MSTPSAGPTRAAKGNRRVPVLGVYTVHRTCHVVCTVYIVACMHVVAFECKGHGAMVRARQLVGYCVHAHTHTYCTRTAGSGHGLDGRGSPLACYLEKPCWTRGPVDQHSCRVGERRLGAKGTRGQHIIPPPPPWPCVCACVWPLPLPRRGPRQHVIRLNPRARPPSLLFRRRWQPISHARTLAGWQLSLEARAQDDQRPSSFADTADKH